MDFICFAKELNILFIQMVIKQYQLKGITLLIEGSKGTFFLLPLQLKQRGVKTGKVLTIPGKI